MLNPFKFELTSFCLVYNGPRDDVSNQWLENVILFGKMHCSRLKKLDIRGGLHIQEFPLKNYLRPDSSDDFYKVERDRPIYLNNKMTLYSQFTEDVELFYVRIPTEFDFTSYTNLVKLIVHGEENRTIKLSHHQTLEYISLIGDLLETQSNEFGVVFENFI